MYSWWNFWTFNIIRYSMIIMSMWIPIMTNENVLQIVYILLCNHSLVRILRITHNYSEWFIVLNRLRIHMSISGLYHFLICGGLIDSIYAWTGTIGFQIDCHVTHKSCFSCFCARPNLLSGRCILRSFGVAPLSSFSGIVIRAGYLHRAYVHLRTVFFSETGHVFP